MTPYQSGCLTAILKTMAFSLVGLLLLCLLCSLGSCVGIATKLPH